jgi:hypothetical protein
MTEDITTGEIQIFKKSQVMKQLTALVVKMLQKKFYEI